MTAFTPKKLLLATAFLVLCACGSSDGGISGTGGSTIQPGDTGAIDTVAIDTAPIDTSATPEVNTGEGEGETSAPNETINTSNSTTAEPTSSGLTTGSNSGTLDTATPLLQWTAVDNADAYRIVLTESEGNQITYNTGTESCAGTSCSATPTAAFYNNTINWRVDALNNNGAALQSSAVGTYSTPISLDLTPVTSNQSVCSVWPSISYDNIIVLNNIWNAGATFSDQWTQLISAEQTSDGTTKPAWDYNWLTEADGQRSAVKAYPQIIYGNKLGTHVSGDKAETGLPELTGNLPQFDIDFKYTETFDGSVERNVAIESFFHDSCSITGPCDTSNNTAYEMMVWVSNPAGTNRPGDLAQSGVLIDGRLWDVYIKSRTGNKEYIAFAAQTDFTEGKINWNSFVDWTVQWTTANSESLNINPLSPDLCMGAIEMGTELWWGKGTFTLDKFVVTKNQP